MAPIEDIAAHHVCLKIEERMRQNGCQLVIIVDGMSLRIAFLGADLIAEAIKRTKEQSNEQETHDA